MIRLLHHVPALAAGLLLAACVEPPAPENKPSGPANKETGKPVRAAKRGELSSISLDDFFALHQSGKALVFDARPGVFHRLGHIPGALSLPKNGCDTSIAAMENDIKQAIADGKTIVVYCNGVMCADARTVASHIARFGYPASIFSGGWDAWKDAELPVE
jgi:rhodanese-related sulfurtransferase